jgi:cytochrome c556
MNGKNPIIRAVEGQTSEPGGPATGAISEDARSDETSSPGQEELLIGSEYETFEDDAEAGPGLLSRLALGLAIIAVIGWTALYGYAIRGDLAGAANAAPGEWVRWIIDWSVPVLLVCVLWLIGMRNSTREAARYAQSAAKLSQESAELETRLTTVNRELSLAREFLASQARDLESLGRLAAERLSTNAAELQALITTNGAQVDAIGTASDTALANMTRLRDDLPVIANSARDVNNQIANTGRTADAQLAALTGGFERLEALGRSSEEQVGALSASIGETIDGFEAKLERIETALAARFTALRTEAEEYRGAVSETETAALDAMNERVALLQAETRAIGAKLREAEAEATGRVHASREAWEQEIRRMIGTLDALDGKAAQASQARIRELHEEAGRFDDKLKQRDVRFFEEIARRQADIETREVQASEALAQRLGALDDMLAERREAHAAETERMVEQGEQLKGQMDRLAAMIAQVRELGEQTRAGLGDGMAVLGETLDAKRASLRETETSLAALTDASVRLLEIIQSGARQSREDLPAAIDSASQHLGALEERSSRLSGAFFTIGQKGEELSSYLIQTNEGLEQADATIEALQQRVAERSDEALAKLNGLRGGLERLSQDSEAFAGTTQEALIEALGKLEEATQATIGALDEGARARVTGLAEALSREAVGALERALRNDSAETIGKLEQAAAHASGVGREATVQLRDQLARVNELTGNLEARVARARELAQEQVDNDFARRMALITDSLNSAAIDITKAMSLEVSDTAWDVYLKGDRGIFTRRAVRLLNAGEVRAVAELYQSDEGFKANVNRYIHDFEAMLRSMLSTRDGNALGVTILGSDMGKLYVALAQGIERFRK